MSVELGHAFDVRPRHHYWLGMSVESLSRCRDQLSEHRADLYDAGIEEVHETIVDLTLVLDAARLLGSDVVTFDVLAAVPS